MSCVLCESRSITDSVGLCKVRRLCHATQVEALQADVSRAARRAADAAAVAAAERDAGATRAARLEAALQEAEDVADDLEAQVCCWKQGGLERQGACC